MSFEAIDRRYRELLRAMQAGQLSEDAFLDQVSELTLRDEQGQWWMIGARDGLWYVWQGGQMVQTTPPGLSGARPAAASSGASSATCAHCGEPLLPGARFCGNCGQSVPTDGPRLCINCHAELEPGARFCGICGQRVGAPEAPLAAQPPLPPAPATSPTPETPIETAPRPPQSSASSTGLAPEAMSPLDEPEFDSLISLDATRPKVDEQQLSATQPTPDATLIAPLAQGARGALVQESEPSPPVEADELDQGKVDAAGSADDTVSSDDRAGTSDQPDGEPAEASGTVEPAPDEPQARDDRTVLSDEAALDQEMAAWEADAAIDTPPAPPPEPIAPVAATPAPLGQPPASRPDQPPAPEPSPVAPAAAAALQQPVPMSAPPPPVPKYGAVPPASHVDLRQDSLGSPPAGGAPPPPPPPSSPAGGGARGGGKRLPRWLLALIAVVGPLLVVGLGYLAATRLFGLDQAPSGEPTVTVAPTLTLSATVQPQETATATATYTPTATPAPGAPVLSVELQARFAQDAGAKAILDAGDVVRYRVSVLNSGESDATGVVLTSRLDDAVELVGDVEVGSGRVVRGGAGDRDVVVTLPRLEAGFEWWIEYYVRLREGVSGPLSQVSAQAEVMSDATEVVLSDDPDTATYGDPTIIEVVLATPTATIAPPTATPTSTPTLTPHPATATPTMTVAPTQTPTTGPTATHTPQPLSFGTALTVSNGAYGSNNVWAEHRDGVFADTPAGRYQCELGFFTTADSQAAMQAAWTQAGRSGANWRMRIVVRGSQSWISCGSNPSCYDNVVEDTTQAELKAEVYMQPAVWNSLASAYAAGGYGAMIANEYYDDMQGMVFGPMGANAPQTPVVSIRFTKVN